MAAKTMMETLGDNQDLIEALETALSKVSFPAPPLRRRGGGTPLLPDQYRALTEKLEDFDMKDFGKDRIRD